MDISKDVEIDKILSRRMLALYNYNEKLVPCKKRNVHVSNQLEKKLKENIHTDIVLEVEKFRRKFQNGENINSNLSRRIFKSEEWDYILNIWDIRHLHLSDSVPFHKNKMKHNRSNYLLFFIVKEDSVYFIDVKEHPTGAEFTNFEFLEILEKNNWLKHINFYEIEGIISLNPIITNNEEIYKMTKLNINLAYKINGKYYRGISGITSFGNKEKHTRKLIDFKKKIKKVSENPKFKYDYLTLIVNENSVGISFKYNLKYKIKNIDEFYKKLYELKKEGENNNAK